MPKVNPKEPNAFTFARVVNAKYKLCSDLRALALALLATMPVEIMEAWGRNELKDADIIKRAGLLGEVDDVKRKAFGG
jgi:hypothetical protein